VEFPRNPSKFLRFSYNFDDISQISAKTSGISTDFSETMRNIPIYQEISYKILKNSNISLGISKKSLKISPIFVEFRRFSSKFLLKLRQFRRVYQKLPIFRRNTQKFHKFSSNYCKIIQNIADFGIFSVILRIKWNKNIYIYTHAI